MDRRDALRELLDAHPPHDGEESRFSTEFRDLLRAPGDPFSRARFAPGHVTASAFVIAPDGVSLLLIRHAGLDRWLQPGGHVEPEDDGVLGAAVRECSEETGLPREALEPVGRGIFDLDIHPIPARRAEPRHLHFDVRFLVRSVSYRIPGGEGTRGARWFRLREVESLDHAPPRRILSKLRGGPAGPGR